MIALLRSTIINMHLGKQCHTWISSTLSRFVVLCINCYCFSIMVAYDLRYGLLKHIHMSYIFISDYIYWLTNVTFVK